MLSLVLLAWTIVATAVGTRPRRDFAGLEDRRRKAGRLFAKGKSQADVSRELEVSRQSVSRWYVDWQARTRGSASRTTRVLASPLCQVHLGPKGKDPGAAAPFQLEAPVDVSGRRLRPRRCRRMARVPDSLGLPQPNIGRVVWFGDRAGDLQVAAEITGAEDSVLAATLGAGSPGCTTAVALGPPDRRR